MYNKKFEATITSTTPFAFEDGQEMRHGVTIGAEAAGVSVDFLEDAAGAKKDRMREILSGELPIKSDVKVQFEKREDLFLRLGEIYKPCQVTEISVSPNPNGEGPTVKLKLKLGQATKETIGYVCSRLRTSESVHIETTQTALEFGKAQADRIKAAAQKSDEGGKKTKTHKKGARK